MAEQLKLSEQLEHPNNKNTHTLTPSTSNPSGNPSERTPSKEKSSKSVKIKMFSRGPKYSVRKLCHYYLNKTLY